MKCIEQKNYANLFLDAMCFKAALSRFKQQREL
jgi:hypothetical protein